MDLMCTVLGHRRDRRKVWHDGDDWRGTCTRCAADLVKAYPSGRWQRSGADAPVPSASSRA